MKNQPTAEVAPAKLTAQQLQILSVTKQNGYTAEALALLFEHLGKTELQDFVSDVDTHIAAYLATTGSIEGTELTALWRIFTFNRALAEVIHFL